MQTPVPVRRPWADQGKKIRNARRRIGISQEKFAPEIGTTRRHVIRLENGEHKPSVALLGRISQRTGEPADSFGYPDEDEEEDADAMADLSASLQRIVQAELRRIRKGLAIGEHA